MTLVNSDMQIITTSRKRFVYRDAQSLVGQPLIGNGECVALAQRLFPGLGHTSTWKAGKRVVECKDSEIPIGTLIGTLVDGKWPGRAHGNHVGIYGGSAKRSVTTGNITSFVLVEQFRHPNVTKIQARELHNKGKGPNGRYVDISNNAGAFYIIEK
jgi:hypothetical protein